MATVSETTRSTRITLGSLTAGPFNVGFRLFDSDGLKVFVNGEASTAYTLTATFDDGYSDTATITLDDAMPADTVIQIDGALIPGRQDDYVNPDPGLTEKINIELARLWAAVSETRMLAYRSVRSLEEIPATDGVSGTNFAEASAAAEETLLARDEVLAIQQTLPQWQSSWLTATEYEFADLVYENGSTYFCVVPHTSGTFSTDLAAMKWEVFAQKGAAGAGVGDVVAANNGTEFNAATFRTNLGLAIGTNVQAYNQLLGAVSGLGSNGLMARLSGSTAAARTITGTAGQITVTNGDGVSGNPTIAAVVASQAEAEAGADTTKLMTPQRAAQAFSSSWASRTKQVRDSKAATGSSQTFTDIPAGVQELELMVDSVSGSAGMAVLLRLGTSGGIVTTGYQSVSATLVGGALPGLITYNTAMSCGGTVTAPGFIISSVSIKRVYVGADVWMMTYNGYRTEDGAKQSGISRVSIGAELTQILVYPSTGTFDSGVFTLAYST